MCSTPDGIGGIGTDVYTLSVAKEGVCSTPDGIGGIGTGIREFEGDWNEGAQRLTASVGSAPSDWERLRKIPECSTPDGIGGIGTRLTTLVSNFEKACSTPDGIGGIGTAYATSYL